MEDKVKTFFKEKFFGQLTYIVKKYEESVNWDYVIKTILAKREDHSMQIVAEVESHVNLTDVKVIQSKIGLGYIPETKDKDDDLPQPKEDEFLLIIRFDLTFDNFFQRQYTKYMETPLMKKMYVYRLFNTKTKRELMKDYCFNIPMIWKE